MAMCTLLAGGNSVRAAGEPIAHFLSASPPFGDQLINCLFGLVADASCIIAVVAGMVFLALQMSYGLAALYVTSAISGLSRGIKLLSKINVILAFALMTSLRVFRFTARVPLSFFGGMVTDRDSFFGMATYRGEAGLVGDPG